MGQPRRGRHLIRSAALIRTRTLTPTLVPPQVPELLERLDEIEIEIEEAKIAELDAEERRA